MSPGTGAKKTRKVKIIAIVFSEISSFFNEIIFLFERLTIRFSTHLTGQFNDRILIVIKSEVLFNGAERDVGQRGSKGLFRKL